MAKRGRKEQEQPPAEEEEEAPSASGSGDDAEGDDSGSEESGSGSSSSDDGSDSFPEVDDEEDQDDDDDDDEDEDGPDEKQITVNFEFFDPKEIDFLGLRSLLQTYLDGQAFDVSGLVDTIIKQASAAPEGRSRRARGLPMQCQRPPHATALSHGSAAQRGKVLCTLLSTLLLLHTGGHHTRTAPCTVTTTSTVTAVV